MGDITLQVCTDDGKSHHVDTPSDILTKEFLREILEGIPAKNQDRDITNWSLDDKSTGQCLPPDRTLEENGVRTGQILLLRLQQAQPGACPDCGLENPRGAKFCRKCGKPLVASPRSTGIKLYIHVKDGAARAVEVSPDKRTADFIAEQLIASDTFTAEKARSEAANWALDDKDTARTLDPQKTLKENRLQGENHLFLRNLYPLPPPKPIPGPPPLKAIAPPLPPRPWRWSKIALVCAGVIAAAAALGIIAHFLMPGTKVAIDPAQATLLGKQAQQFTATVTGAKNPAVQWSLRPSVGKISPAGLYAAPGIVLSEQTVTVTARSRQNAANFATATVTLEPAKGTVVHVTPAMKALAASESAAFTAQVSGSPNTDVTWTINPQVGNIAQDGTYHAPASVPSELSVKVTASSVAYPDAAETATVTLQPVQISLRSVRAPLVSGPALRLSAMVTGSADPSVKWSMSGPGSIARNGVYSPPAFIPAPETVRITATSNADSTKFATTAFTLQPIVSVSMNLTSASIGVGEQQQFSASVSGSSNQAVRWSLSGVGVLKPNGLYSAPVSIAQQEVVRVTATSLADPSKFAGASITLRPLLITVGPAGGQLKAAQMMRFSALLNGAPNGNVRWSLAGPGNISPDGVYKAPSSISSDMTAKVMATSTVDPTRSGAALVNLVRSEAQYSGPRRGVLVLSGELPKNYGVTIEGNTILDHGLPLVLKGNPFPGVPVQISLSSKNFVIVSAPAPSNGWRRLILRSLNGKPSTVNVTWYVLP